VQKSDLQKSSKRFKRPGKALPCQFTKFIGQLERFSLAEIQDSIKFGVLPIFYTSLLNHQSFTLLISVDHHPMASIL